MNTPYSAVSQGQASQVFYTSIHCLSNGLKNYNFHTTVIKAKLSLCTCTWNKQRDMRGPFDQSIRKQTLMQKPCNWVCADQTVSNHQRANNKLLFSEGQQSQQHHQLDSRVCVFFLSTDREPQASQTLLCLAPYLQTLHYCEDDGEMNADCFLNSEGVKSHILPCWWVEMVPFFKK